MRRLIILAFVYSQLLMKTKSIKIRSAICAILTIGATLCISSVPAEEALQIDKAYFGASGSWRDVTAFLRSQLKGEALSVDISQPFAGIGGDPSPGNPKHLLIDYRFNGVPFRLLLEEQYPVAFQVSLPSAEAAPPGKDPKSSAIMEQIKAKPVPISGALWQRWIQHVGKYGDRCLSWFTLVVSLIAVASAGAAMLQVRQIKRELRRIRNDG
jgi:hypothetical protein